ncbi:methionine-binding protein [Neisseria sp.]
MKALALSITLLLSACVYTETPYGRTTVLDLPIHSQTTVNKNVTINAPLGWTTVL